MHTSNGSRVRPRALAWTAILAYLLQCVTSLNIDTRFPVEFKYPGRLLTQAPPHFGHSVLIVNSSESNQFSFLIGAPNENYAPARTVRSGSIYQCEWSPQLANVRCERLNIQFQQQSAPTNDSHLGFNLVAQPSQQQQYLSCAFSRAQFYTETDSQTGRPTHYLHPNGACYQLKVGQTRPLASILPLAAGEKQFQSSSSKSESIMYYAYAMAGFSSAFSSNGLRLFLGAPGFEHWRGGLVEIKSDNPNRKNVFAPFQETTQDISLDTYLNNDSYIGYSMSTGHFFRSSQTNKPIEYVVLGAPRANFKGSVTLFGLEPSNRYGHIQLNGAQTGEYFGNSLLVLDINRDGLDDLLVGAPMYSSLKKGVADEGRVFVYFSNGQKLVQTNILYGARTSDARFGTSMASLGDINHDGFNDVVIGAPYEEGGRGAIYIYRGKRDGLSSEVSQKVSASDLPYGHLLGFGYSLSSDVDVDQNRYNDLLVGSYLSNNAVLLRTRPITSLQAFLQTSHDHFDLGQACPTNLLSGVQSNASCITVRICFNTAHFDDSYQLAQATLWLDTQMAPSNERCSIILDNGDILTSTLTTTIPIVKRQDQVCSQSYTVLMKEKIVNYLDPVVFKLSYDFSHAHLDQNNIFKVPVVEGALTNTTAQIYLKMCSRTAKDCVSKLRLEPFVQLEGEQATVVSGPALQRIELVDGLHQRVRIRIVTLNQGEPAFDTKLSLSLNSSVSLVSIDSACRLTSTNETTSSIECHLESPLYGTQEVEIALNPFDTFKPVQCVVSLAVANQLAPSSVVERRMVIRKVKLADIDLKVTESPPLIRFKSESGNASFESIVQIERTKYSTIESLDLFLTYPASYDHKQLASPLDITNLNNRIRVVCDLETTSNELTANSLEILTNKNDQKILNLACGRPKVLCKQLKCRIGPMTGKAAISYIKFSSKLMVGLVNEEFGYLEYDQIAFNVNVKTVIRDENIAPVATNVAKNIEFTFKPVDPILEEQVPIWPYLIGGLIGLIIIILLVWGLAKFGFFKRGSAKIAEKEDEDALNGAE